MKRLILLLITLFALADAAAAKDIVLGASVQMTGSLANTGRYYRDAYQMAVDRINAAGGVKVGGARYQLALKLLDNQSDVSLSVRQYVELLAQDKVNLLLGPFASDFALADSSVAEKYQVPMIQGGALPIRSSPAATNTSSGRCRWRASILTAPSRRWAS